MAARRRHGDRARLGTGLGTGHLIERFDDVASDLSMAMLHHQPDLAPKVQADASMLPFATTQLISSSW